jgi:hypothetical protein
MRYRRLSLTVLAAFCAAPLFGCTSWTPDKVEILVGTLPPGASCLVSRGGQPIATAAPTPAIARIDPAAGDVAISCHRRGFQDATVTLPPAQPGSPGPFSGPPPEDFQRHVEIALVPR